MLEVFILAVQNTQEMYKDCLPDTKFELVHEIYNEHVKQIKTELCQLVQKHILRWIWAIKKTTIEKREQVPTAVGTRESSCRRFSTTLLLTA